MQQTSSLSATAKSDAAKIKKLQSSRPNIANSREVSKQIKRLKSNHEVS